jgi:hypothetical protein
VSARAALRVVVLHDGGVPERLEEAYRASTTAPPLLTLARALAGSRVWDRGPPSTLVARPEPTPVLAAIGPFGPEDEARLSALHHHLRSVVPRTVYLDHRAAEAACERLAERIASRLAPSDLARARFVGIPRGGLIVLGLVAYALGLPRERLGAGAEDRLLVVVDDVVVSGLRLLQFLGGRPEREVVVATLYSHPDLRAALRAHTPQVREIVSAFDLADHAPRELGEGYGAWHAAWRGRSDPRALWIGRPDHVCFAWGEPETSFWNPVTEREELGWQVLPPELCLKHRHAAGTGTLTAQLQRAGEGAYRPSAGVVVGELGADVVIGHLESQGAYALDPVGSDMWRALLTSSDDDAAVATLAGAYDADPATLRSDLRAFVVALRGAGILETGPP